MTWHESPVHMYESVGSTNDVAMQLAEAGAIDGTAVIADQQSAGRGRHGRDWWSPPGAGLYLSLILRPGIADASLGMVTLAAGVALAGTVRAQTGLPVELKWPNDLVIGRPWRKLAGILCEATQLGTSDACVIVGMGVNLRRSAYPPEIADRVTSIAEECAVEISRDQLALACRGALEAALVTIREHGPAQVLDQWRVFGAAALDHAPVRWRDAEGEQRGTTVDLDADGALIVRAMGMPRTQRIVSGEVTWEMLTRD